MPIQLLIREEIIGKNGEVKFDSGLRPSHSIVLQFMQVFEGLQVPKNMANVRDTGNVLRSIACNPPSPFCNCFGFIAPDGPTDGVTNHGIVVGSGSGAESNTDYQLTQIAHGTGGGQLCYNDGRNYTVAGVVGVNVDLTFWRTFTNKSGGNVTVNEIGVYGWVKDSTSADRRYICIARDVLSPSRVLADQDTYRVTYTWRTSVGVL